MTDACNTCGKTSSLMNCKRCKSVAYCSADCQRQDWKTHKAICQRKEFAGAPCDCCGSTENVEGGLLCVNCGSLHCAVCDEQHLTRDLASQVVSYSPCIRCHQRRVPLCFRDHKKLEKLIKESPRDPRLAHWCVRLGRIFAHFDDSRRGEEKAKEHFLRAGELGYGAGFTRVAEICIKNRNWDEARRYYQMAAEKFHVVALGALANEARRGYFQFSAESKFGEIIQEDHRRPLDLEEAFRLYQEGARLGYPECCANLGMCYQQGLGTEKDFAKAFKWIKRAVDKGDVKGMNQIASMYLVGEGVEQSTEQAIYWYEKYLELEENEYVRTILQGLRFGVPFP